MAAAGAGALPPSGAGTDTWSRRHGTSMKNYELIQVYAECGATKSTQGKRRDSVTEKDTRAYLAQLGPTTNGGQ